MPFSRLPLCYCTNVHPGRSVDDVLRGLDHYTLPVKERCQESLAAGLWLARGVVDEILSSQHGAQRFRDELQTRGLSCHTLNAFPYGDFHSERVKENVYIPDWTDPRRLEYTKRCARILAALLPDEADGSMSTVPLGFKPFVQPPNPQFLEEAASQLLELATFLKQLHAETGQTIRLAIEPEPCCVLETTGETREFFRFLFDRAASAGVAETVREHIGVCYDVCHQAVEFEDVGDSVGQLAQSGVRINKVHISCALKVERPNEHPAVREALARYVEPRYLHQTTARMPEGGILRTLDLSEEFTRHPPDDYAACDEWRVHFHVPVNAEHLGPLGTTREELKQALTVVAEFDGDDAPHLEVETYTWEVLPDGARTDLVTGLSTELTATRTLLEDIEHRGERRA